MRTCVCVACDGCSARLVCGPRVWYVRIPSVVRACECCVIAGVVAVGVVFVGVASVGGVERVVVAVVVGVVGNVVAAEGAGVVLWVWCG